ncbi:carboxypeptidase B-like [Pollicipes pollicipes]|uniref:carboxypeptidase B-like n=1 Tax=Pollicipes pollicipes TaxID=41117 RepID=UPI0018858F7C|nr:carboxypeptidase B-like [Pollicipes pollicipes]
MGPLVSLLLLLLTPAAVPGHGQVHVQSSRGDTGLVPALRLRTEQADNAAQYAGYQVLRVNVDSNGTLDLLRTYEDRPGVDFWTPISPLVPTVDVMVSPDVRSELTRRLKDSGGSYGVNIGNVQDAIVRQNPIPSPFYLELLEGRQGYQLTWKAYHRLAVHHQYMDYVEHEYRGLCSTFSIGISTEGRNVKGIRCGLGEREIWIDGGIHAREWISPAVVSYLVKDFSATSYKEQDILKAFTIYMIPVLNPDGYEYTHTGRRMWRKTRSRTPGSSCVGADPNRNFGYHWGEAGTSTNPCSDVYPGSRPFSEPETRGVRDFLLQHKNKMEMYISFHSYSQMLFVPYGHGTERPSDYDELLRVAQKGAAALQAAGGPAFRVGQASRLLYAASGGSDDWAKAKANIKYSFTFELRDKGFNGFLLPSSLIEQSGRETAAAVKAMIRAIL